MYFFVLIVRFFSSRNNFTVSLDQFTPLKRIDYFSTYIFVVKKNGGSDNGKIYLLKGKKIAYYTHEHLKEYCDHFKGERMVNE